MKKTLRITLLALAVVAGTTTLWADDQNIITVAQSLSDNDIAFPESFETNTNEMMKNWYLQNYTIMDANVENTPVNDVSDQEYVKRLAAMPTVIEMPYNQVVRAYIDRYIKRNRTLVEQMLGMSLYYMPIFEKALEREQLPLELRYLPVIESALNPQAVSRDGAAGLWQLQIDAARGQGLEVNSLVDERRDTYKGTDAAVRYLKNLHDIYNDWSLALAAYNCGTSEVNKALQRAGGKGKDYWAIYNQLPRETRGFVPAFIAANYVMTYYKQHGISPVLASKPLITDTLQVAERVHFEQIAHALNITVDQLRVLNPQFRQDIIPGDSRAYTLILPSQQAYSYIMSEDSIVNYRKDLYANRTVVNPGEDKTVEGYAPRYDTDEQTVAQATAYVPQPERVEREKPKRRQQAEERPAHREEHKAERSSHQERKQESRQESKRHEKKAEEKSHSKTHKVKRGESLYDIAHDNGVTVSELRAANGIKGDKIKAGQTLTIPAKSGRGSKASSGKKKGRDNDESASKSKRKGKSKATEEKPSKKRKGKASEEKTSKKKSKSSKEESSSKKSKSKRKK